MGRNRNAARANQQNQNEQARFGAQSNQLNTLLQQELAKTQGRSNDLYGTERSRLDQMYNDPRLAQIIQGGAANPYYKSLAGGGINEADKARMRGSGYYEEYAKTGGWDDKRKAEFRDRSASTGRSIYSNLSDELSRSRAAQGGYAPGFDSQTAKLVREKSRAADEALNNSELGMADSIDTNRKFGITGISDSERSLQDILSRNKIAGAGGLAQGDSTSLAALGLKGDTISGMEKLRTTPGAEMGVFDQLLKSLGLGTEARQALIGQYMQYNPNQNWFQKYGIPLIGAGASAAGAAAGGGG